MKVALAGGIASGKSAVLATLKDLGAAVIDSDLVAREISDNSDYIRAVGLILGDKYIENGRINRVALREAIARDLDARKKLNSISHPIIRERVNKEAEVLEKAGKVVFVEIPLLITSGMARDFDAIWFVDCAIDERIARILERDNVSREQALALIKAQAVEQSALELADFVIDTTGSPDKTNEISAELEKLRAENNRKRNS